MSNTGEHTGGVPVNNGSATDQQAGDKAGAARTVTFAASLGAMFLMATSAIETSEEIPSGPRQISPDFVDLNFYLQWSSV